MQLWKHRYEYNRVGDPHVTC